MTKHITKDKLERKARRKRMFAAVIAAFLALIFILGMAVPIVFGN